MTEQRFSDPAPIPEGFREITWEIGNAELQKSVISTGFGMDSARATATSGSRSRSASSIFWAAGGSRSCCAATSIFCRAPSLRMLESAGLRNLVAEFGVSSTRTSLYARPEKFADYVLVSDGIIVHDFRVLPDEVSDHAQLLLELEWSGLGAAAPEQRAPPLCSCRENRGASLPQKKIMLPSLQECTMFVLVPLKGTQCVRFRRSHP
jgi:hypothetical protein